MKYAAPLFHLSGMDVTIVEVGLSLNQVCKQGIDWDNQISSEKKLCDTDT